MTRGGCAGLSRHQVHPQSPSFQKTNPQTNIYRRKIGTVAVPNRLYEKNQFLEPISSKRSRFIDRKMSLGTVLLFKPTSNHTAVTPTRTGGSYRRRHIPPAQAPSHIRIRSSRRARLLTQQRAQPDGTSAGHRRTDELDERMRGTLALPNPSRQPSAPVDETVGRSRRRPKSSGRKPKEPQRQAPGRGPRRQDANVCARTAPQAPKRQSSHLQI